MGHSTTVPGEAYVAPHANIQLESEHDTSNYYASLVQSQKIAQVSSFTLESNITLESVPVAYSTWGTLNENRDNVLVVCHALTGSSDALDWWRPLIGPGKALDYTRYFIFCGNVLGSPYGSASPLSANPATGLPYGPTFPDTTIRDDVRIHKRILDTLGVRSVAAVIGGSMGGMTTLEWPLCTPPGYVKNTIPIATAAYHGAWGISWAETQRQSIYSDPAFKDGWYDPIPEGQPSAGLGTARMIAMLTYRSHHSFEARFSRKPAAMAKKLPQQTTLPTPPSSHRSSVASETDSAIEARPPVTFAAQSYLHYQASKFLARFDANCYIHLTRKMDSHDVTHKRLSHAPSHPPSEGDLREVLSTVASGALVVSVGTDVLFRPEQQMELANCLPDAELVMLESEDGHDGFLLEFEQLNKVIQEYLDRRCPCAFRGNAGEPKFVLRAQEVVNSVFGEAEAVEF